MKINKVILHQTFQTQEEVFRFLAHVLFEEGSIGDEEAYRAALEEREAQGTTGLIDGFAIPHGKSNTVKEAAVVYVRNTSGIEWNSLDGSKITDIFALAIPENEGKHLESLIAISTQLMDQDQCVKLRSLVDENEIRNIFE